MNIIKKFFSTINGESMEEEHNLPENDGLANKKYANDFSKRPSATNVFDLASASQEGTGMLNMKVIIYEPNVFDDVQQVANCLKENRPVLVNFEKTEISVSRRIVDFISGTTYALNGEIKKVGNNVYLCVPHNVNISYTDDLKKTKLAEFPWQKK